MKRISRANIVVRLYVEGAKKKDWTIRYEGKTCFYRLVEFFCDPIPNILVVYMHI